METKYKTDLETLFERTSPIASRIPDEAYDLRFVGYDSSGTTIDTKGVLRVSFSREPGSDLIKLLSSQEISVKGTNLDEEINELEKRIISMKTSTKYINNDYHEKIDRSFSRLDKLKGLKRQVEESLEDPRVHRESRGRLVNNPVINGVEYVVNLARTQTQIGEGSLPYYLKGDELVISDASKQILAHRYFRDPNVIVHGTFEGNVRKPKNFNLELDEKTKINLTILFKNLYPEIGEVSFPDGERRKVN